MRVCDCVIVCVIVCSKLRKMSQFEMKLKEEILNRYSIAAFVRFPARHLKYYKILF